MTPRKHQRKEHNTDANNAVNSSVNINNPFTDTPNRALSQALQDELLNK